MLGIIFAGKFSPAWNALEWRNYLTEVEVDWNYFYSQLDVKEVKIWTQSWFNFKLCIKNFKFSAQNSEIEVG